MFLTKNLRGLVALTLALMAGSAFAQTVTVVEFYNKSLNAFFITGRLFEQQALDRVSDFSRTGMSFEARAAGSGGLGTKRICRFYINLSSPFTSSHFYGREDTDCAQIQAQNPSGFTYEGFDFATTEATSGACPAGTTVVYRGFRAAAGGRTPNHRYTTSAQTYDIAQSQGFAGEGAVFCVTNATDAVPVFEAAQKCGTYYYPGKRIGYQSRDSKGIVDSFQRYLTATTSTFNQRSDATAVIEDYVNQPPTSIMIADGPTRWTALGSSTTDATGVNEIYYTRPTVYPRDYAAGQFVPIDTELAYSRPNSLGTVKQSGKVTFIGKESVTVPLGTYANACIFLTQLSTTYQGTGEVTTASSTQWVADNVGIIKTVTDVETSSPTKPPTNLRTTIEAVSVQPL